MPLIGRVFIPCFFGTCCGAGRMPTSPSGGIEASPMCVLTRSSVAFIHGISVLVFLSSSYEYGGNWVIVLMGCGRRWFTARSPGYRPQPLLDCSSTHDRAVRLFWPWMRRVRAVRIFRRALPSPHLLGQVPPPCTAGGDTLRRPVLY